MDTNNPTELNRYVYAANNPVNATDPTGHSLLETSIQNTFSRAASGALGGALGGFVGSTFYVTLAQLGTCGIQAAAIDNRTANLFIAKSTITGAMLGGALGVVAGVGSGLETAGLIAANATRDLLSFIGLSVIADTVHNAFFAAPPDQWLCNSVFIITTLLAGGRSSVNAIDNTTPPDNTPSMPNEASQPSTTVTVPDDNSTNLGDTGTTDSNNTSSTAPLKLKATVPPEFILENINRIRELLNAQLPEDMRNAKGLPLKHLSGKVISWIESPERKGDGWRWTGAPEPKSQNQVRIDGTGCRNPICTCSYYVERRPYRYKWGCIAAKSTRPSHSARSMAKMAKMVLSKLNKITLANCKSYFIPVSSML